MFAVTAISFIALVATLLLYLAFDYKLLYSLSITFGSVFYHFAMRLCVGYVVNSKFNNKMNYNCK